MAERIWDKFLTEPDKAVFAASGYGALQGFGKRPALMIIDVNYFFCGDRPEPIRGVQGEPREGPLAATLRGHLADLADDRQTGRFG